MLINKGFRFFIEKVFFNKKCALIFCVLFSLISFCIEILLCKESLFPSSGAIFILAGIFLNIKLTAHYHLRLPNGEPLGVDSKYAMISGEGVFGGSENRDEKVNKVKEVESDEIWGASLMVVGTLISAYGQHLIKYIESIKFMF